MNPQALRTLIKRKAQSKRTNPDMSPQRRTVCLLLTEDENCFREGCHYLSISNPDQEKQVNSGRKKSEGIMGFSETQQ